jgi:TRAP-type C4-dicarboxylate transport system permease small subunit
VQKLRLIRIARAIEQPVERAIRALLVVLFSLMLGLSTLQIALRFFLGTSIPWADQAARALVLWCGLLGSVLAAQANKHFNIDVLTRFLAPGTRRRFRVLAEVLAAVVCCALVWASFDFLIIGVDRSEEAFAGVTVFAVAMIFPVSFALMALQFIFRALTEAAGVSGEQVQIKEQEG